MIPVDGEYSRVCNPRCPFEKGEASGFSLWRAWEGSSSSSSQSMELWCRGGRDESSVRGKMLGGNMLRMGNS